MIANLLKEHKTMGTPYLVLPPQPMFKPKSLRQVKVVLQVLLLFNCSIVSDSWRSHGLQHASQIVSHNESAVKTVFLLGWHSWKCKVLLNRTWWFIFFQGRLFFFNVTTNLDLLRREYLVRWFRLTQYLISQFPTRVEVSCCKLLQLCPTLSDPIDSSPPGSAVPGILQARTLEWIAIFFFNAWKWKVKVKSLGCVWLFETPWTVAH